MSKIQLTKGQQKAFDGLKSFLHDSNLKVFILKGYAGTGKTTLMSELIREMQIQNLEFKLLASTGRAAKILSNTTGVMAKTIHSEIYKFSDLNQDLEAVVRKREETKVDETGQLMLNFELVSLTEQDKDVIHYYIIDEASMVSDTVDKNAVQAMFGSGKLLTDLFKYDTSGKFIFVGDVCQLPPITQAVSPALSSEYITENFGLQCQEMELTEVVRQTSEIDIVNSAHKVRELFYNPQTWKWAKFPMKGYKDIHIVSNQATLMSQYIGQIKESGFNSATLLCYSNKQCDISTGLIRPSFGHLSPRLEKGDLLLVTQNNLISGLMNGDLGVIEEVGVEEHRAGLTFLNVSIKELFTQKVYSQLLIADILYGNQTNLSQTQQKELYIDYYIRMKAKGIKQNSPLFKHGMYTDPYLNALRTVYGYALTCHKAQGGEWDYVYLDISKNVPVLEKPYVYQWIYTAMTRAKKGLYIVEDFWLM